MAGSYGGHHPSQRIGLIRQPPAGATGSGTNNDGVFTNVTAKPTAPCRVVDGMFYRFIR
jgi:hypothetical protein